MPYTPGPWYVDSEMPPNPFGVIFRMSHSFGNENIPISSPHATPDYSITPEVDLANAYLVSAAPDLLEACKTALQWQEFAINLMEELSDAIRERWKLSKTVFKKDQDQLMEDMASMRVAINKAEGK